MGGSHVFAPDFWYSEPERLGMGLLEYQAMPSLRDVAHDQTPAGNSVSLHPGSTYQENRFGTEKAGNMARPSRIKITPVGSLSSSQLGGPPCWSRPLAFGLIGQNHPHPTTTAASFQHRPESAIRAGIFKPLWSPGIDAKASIPPAYVAWRAGTITLFLLGA